MTSTLGGLIASTAVGDLMKTGVDPASRQSAFDRWTTELTVALRRKVERLGISRRRAADGTEFLLIESPEPVPFSEDLSLALVHIKEDATRTSIATAVLSDGAECRAFVLPLSPSGVPEPLPGGAYGIL